MIHGTEDEVIDVSHGIAIYESCPRAVEPLWVDGAGHNDVELFSQYLERLREFIDNELNWQAEFVLQIVFLSRAAHNLHSQVYYAVRNAQSRICFILFTTSEIGQLWTELQTLPFLSLFYWHSRILK